MCIIAVCRGEKLSENVIQNCARANRDGIGLAWWDTKKKIWKFRKGFMGVQEFSKFYANIPTGLHVVHFRLASVGEVCPELTHPFEIAQGRIAKLRLAGHAKALLFHNGSIPGWERYIFSALSGKRIRIPSDFGVMSDTRAFSIFLSLKYNDKLAEVKENGGVSKYAVCLPSGKVKIYGHWIQEGNFHFSNYGYRDITTYGGYWTSWWRGRNGGNSYWEGNDD